jgi:hypothetical protein
MAINSGIEPGNPQADVGIPISGWAKCCSTKVTLHLFCYMSNVTLHYYSALNAGLEAANVIVQRRLSSRANPRRF